MGCSSSKANENGQKYTQSNSAYTGKYTEGKELGRGQYAIVKEVTKKDTDEKYASKIIDMTKLTDSEKESILNEVAIMQSLKVDGKNHPNIIGFIEKFSDDPATTFLILELVTGEELFDRIVKKTHYSEQDAASTMMLLVKTMGFLHERNIVHRDLKPENLLYADPSEDSPIKVADFGLALEIKDGKKLTHKAGTPEYAAPEVLSGEGYGRQVDMWALGVVLYIMLCGFPPFYDQDMAALFEKIKKCDYEFLPPWWDSISDEAKDCVRGFLNLDPDQRYCAFPPDAPNYALRDRWFQRYNDGTINTEDLQGTQAQLKKYQATKKLKKAATGMIAVQRMAMDKKEVDTSLSIPNAINGNNAPQLASPT